MANFYISLYRGWRILMTRETIDKIHWALVGSSITLIAEVIALKIFGGCT